MRFALLICKVFWGLAIVLLKVELAWAVTITVTNGPEPLWQHAAFVPWDGDDLQNLTAVYEARKPVTWQRGERGLLLLLPGITAPGATRCFTTSEAKPTIPGPTDLTVRETAYSVVVANSYFQVKHPKEGNGGFPTSLRFNQSGTEDQQFVFEDRLYAKRAGYRTWRSDGKGTARVVELGPLEAIIETKARAEGAPGNPGATYRYRYRAYSPVVEITAHIERDDDFAWAELHFLQISRKDNLYPNWAGGEPIRTGVFTDARRSFYLDRWALMSNDADAVGLALEGAVSVFDGVSEYFNYLQQSLGPFKERSVDLRAQVYIGPVRPPEQIRNWLTRPPLVSVRKGDPTTAPEPDRSVPRSAPITAHSGGLAVGFAKESEGMGLVSLFSRRTGREFLTRTSGKPLLWRLVLRHREEPEIKIDNTASARLVSATRSTKAARQATNEAIELTWTGLAVADEPEALTVRVGIELPQKSDTSLWTIDVENHSKRYGLWEVQFPLFVGLSESGLPDVAVPRSNWGHLYRSAATALTGSYPSADWPMQFLLMNEGDAGLYLAAQDPGAQPKRFSFTPGGEFFFSTYAEDMGVPASSFHAPFPAAVGVYKGDWWNGIKRYRAWALRQPWTSRGPLATRKDTPQAMEDLALWMLSGGTKEEVTPGMLQAKEFFQVPMGVHWYNWHQIPFDVHYPDYFPTKPNFAEGVRALAKAGIIAMPYVNGRLWDTANEDFAVGRPGACKQSDGKSTYIEEYGSGAKLAPMCPTTQVWQDRVNEIVGRLITECGVNAIYLDQIGAAGPQLCFDASHGHPLGGGRHWVDGYRELLTRVRAQTKGRVGITTENNAEPYMDNVDAFLIWNPRSEVEIPMMTAVYSGYTIYFSSPAYGAYEPQAFRMIEGRDFIWGCQQGWMGFELLDTTQRRNAEYLRELARYRKVARDFVVYGELVGELKQTVPPLPVEATWGGWAGAKRSASLPAVMGTIWRSRDGRGALLIANLSDLPQRLTYPFDPRGWGLANATQWTLTRLAPAATGQVSRTPVALLSSCSAEKVPQRVGSSAAPVIVRPENLGPAEVLVLEIAPTPSAKAAQVLAQIRRAKARVAPQALSSLASFPKAEANFLTQPRAGESCVLQVRIRNGESPVTAARLMLDLPANWKMEPGRALNVDDLRPGEMRTALFRCDVPADAGGSVSVRASVATVQAAKRFPVAPPRPVAAALHFLSPPVLDGDLSEWQSGAPILLNDGAHSKVKDWKGQSDLSGKVWTGWDAKSFYFAAAVTDDVFEQPGVDREIWRGDCVQIGLRPGPPTELFTYDNVHEFGLALTPRGPEVWKWLPDETEVTSGALSAVRRSEGLAYEAAIPWSAVGDLAPIPDGTLGFSFTLNDADGQGFRGWMEWTPGICGSKDASWFGRMRLVP